MIVTYMHTALGGLFPCSLPPFPIQNIEIDIGILKYVHNSNGSDSFIDVIYICENINANLNIMYGEGEGAAKEGGRGKLTKCCVHVCHYHSELHYDVRLQCTNRIIKKEHQ